MAIALLLQSISEALILQVGDLDTSKAIWNAIKTRHVGAERVREARLQTLMADFDRLKMKDVDTINAFVGKLSEISSYSVALAETIDESKLVKRFLNSLPWKRYIHIIAALEQVPDLNTTGFEDIVGRFKAYEERIGEEEEEQHEDHNKLMYATWTHHNRIKEIMAVIEEEDEEVVLPGEEEVAEDMEVFKVEISGKTKIKSISLRSHVFDLTNKVIMPLNVPIGCLNYKKQWRRKIMILTKPMS